MTHDPPAPRKAATARRARNHTGLLAEEVDSVSGELLGN